MKYQFGEMADTSLLAARKIVPLLLEILPNTKSMIDVGGGLGQWCKAFKENGLKEILCLDHPSINKKDLLIDEKEFLAIDFESGFPVMRQKFDLALSLEFAEHISPTYSMELVKFLTGLSDVILFSSAIPKQGGLGHINEQRLKFWNNLFQECKFEYLDAIRPLIMGIEEIPFYYKQNIMLYVNQNIVNKYRLLKQFNINPNEFEIVSTNLLDRDLGVIESLRSLLKSVLRKLNIKK